MGGTGFAFLEVGRTGEKPGRRPPGILTAFGGKEGLSVPLRTDPHPPILIVDDDGAVRESLAAGLAAAAYSVHTAATGTDAVAVLRAHAIAGIILDAILQYEHGLDLVPRFRQLSSAPILLLTGHGSEALAARAVWSRVQGYLNKPVSLEVLHAAVADLLAVATAGDALVRRVRLALDAYPPQPFRAQVFARQFGVSEMHLRRRFRAACGMTPAQYLTGVRLERAAALLRATDASVAEIAFDMGIPNVAWFTAIFRERFGQPPGAYRDDPADDGLARCRQALSPPDP